MKLDDRRSFLRAVTGAALTTGLLSSPAVSVPAGAADIRFGLSGQLWDGDGTVVKLWGGNIDEGVKETARTGFQASSHSASTSCSI